MSPVPELTTEQRKEYLAKAMEARSRRRRMLVSVKSGALSVLDYLAMAEHDDVVAKTRVVSLIKAAPGYGPSRAKRLMNDLGISEARRIKGLGRNQLDALCKVFGGGRLGGDGR